MQHVSAVFCLNCSSSVWLLTLVRGPVPSSVGRQFSLCFSLLPFTFITFSQEGKYIRAHLLDTKKRNLQHTNTLFCPNTQKPSSSTGNKTQPGVSLQTELKPGSFALSSFLTSLGCVLLASRCLGYVWIWKAVSWRGKPRGLCGSAQETHLGADDLGLCRFSGPGSLHHFPNHPSSGIRRNGTVSVFSTSMKSKKWLKKKRKGSIWFYIRLCKLPVWSDGVKETIQHEEKLCEETHVLG